MIPYSPVGGDYGRQIRGLERLGMAPLYRHLSPRADTTRAGDAAYPVSPGCEYVVVRADHGLPLVRSPARATMGVEKRRASMAPALAGRWYPRGHASPDPRDC